MKVKKEKGSNRKKYVIWLVVFPIILTFACSIYVLPQILTASNRRTQIPSSGLFPDMALELIIESSVEDLGMGYFTSQCTMNLYIEENSTRKTSYNIMVIPMGLEPGPYGVHIPFENLQHEYPSYLRNLLTMELITCDKYFYSRNLRMPIASSFPERFPGDFYLSSTIYVWFSGAFYPEITLSPTSSVPRGFILSLTEPRLVNATHFYLNILPPVHRISVSLPPNDVLAFEIVIQRDMGSLLLNLVYIGFLLWFTSEVIAISHLKIKQVSDRLKILVGLSITSIAFLWSVREVANVITWSETVLAFIIGLGIFFEIKDALSE